MPDKQPALFTFHKVREQCEQGDTEAWRAFLDFYGPLCLHLIAMYAPSGDASPAGPEARARIFEKLLAALGENNCQGLHGTARQSEREFLADVRALALDTMASFRTDAVAAGERRAADLETPDQLGKLMEGLPLMHQEMLFFKLAGYSDASIERMLRVAPRVAEKAFERLPAGWPQAQRPEEDRCPRPKEWLALLREIRAAKKETCPERHLLMRIQDGQVSWYDKEPMEKHAATCGQCLESWTALREVTHWRRVAEPLSSAEIGRFLRALPLAATPSRSLFKRVFGGS